MSKDAKLFWLGFGIIVAFVLIVWFLSQIIEILRQHPQPLWFTLGIVATLVVEGIALFGIRVFKRLRGY